MDVPLEVSFHHTQKTAALEDLIRKRAARLEKFHQHLISCSVTVEQPQTHQRSGNPYRVRLEVRVPPGHSLIVNARPETHAMHDPVERVLLDAFKTMERQLKELAERQRLEVKQHDVPHAFVVRLFPDRGYGFLRTPEGREIYFQQTATLHHDWERLEVGTQVRFEETMGEMGPQATTVQIIDKPGSRIPDNGEEAVDVPLGWQAGSSS
jgi:cold shock CspA family protein/ribosome-associated translation inhibitor RaiA